ncbi:hypothetical protein [Catenuloplanes indicus]|uniref:Uncharacterized protein n=1 Tax=Catenuloplanes indicus TaxID=137267 RepID=A0AAE3VW58_9ACTN|nr:hypothetical protein [Catenuloplanes indicus]MDQ0364439.1 hypothetical protein [Catenuloplanes indicus]
MSPPAGPAGPEDRAARLSRTDRTYVVPAGHVGRLGHLPVAVFAYATGLAAPRADLPDRQRRRHRARGHLHTGMITGATDPRRTTSTGT